MLNALAAALSPGKDLTPSTHRLRRGLPGYLILFAPHAFEPQRQLQTREPLSPPVFLHISTHFTATHGIPLSPSALKLNSFQSLQWLSHCLSLQTYLTACARFTPNKSGQRSGPTYYRGCWLVFFVYSGSVCTFHFPSFLIFFHRKTEPKTFLLLHGFARSGFPPHCRRFPTAASRRSLGRVSVPVWPITLSGRLCIVALVRPLPHQLANTTQVHLVVMLLHL